MNHPIVGGISTLRQQELGLLDDRLEVVLIAQEVTLEAGSVLAPARIALHDAHPLVEVAEPGDIDAEPEAIEQLRPKVPLLGVHRAHEDEARRVRERDALALHDVPSHRRGVEEDVDDVIVEQVHLVHVEDAAVGVGEEPRLEAAFPELDGGLGVDGPDDAILGRVDGQLHDPGPAALDDRGDPGFGASATVVAPRRRRRRDRTDSGIRR